MNSINQHVLNAPTTDFFHKFFTKQIPWSHDKCVQLNRWLYVQNWETPFVLLKDVVKRKKKTISEKLTVVIRMKTQTHTHISKATKQRDSFLLFLHRSFILHANNSDSAIIKVC